MKRERDYREIEGERGVGEGGWFDMGEDRILWLPKTTIGDVGL